MSENIGTGGAEKFNTTIPSLSDNADIQTALRLYHYGEDTTNPGTLLGDGTEEFIAGYLQTLENTKLGQDPTILAASASLNDNTTTGFYIQPNTPSSPGTYPSAHAGFLIVISDGTNVFQQYQVIGVSESGSASSTNKAWWRFYYGGSWKVWRSFVTSGEFTGLGDLRYVQGVGGVPTFISNYYTKTESDNKFATITGLANSQYVSEVQKTDNYTLVLTDASKVINMSSSLTKTVTIPTNASVEFPIGTLINVYGSGTGAVRVAAVSGVTLRPYGTGVADGTIELFEQYTEISLRKRDTNEWVASGNFLEV